MLSAIFIEVGLYESWGLVMGIPALNRFDCPPRILLISPLQPGIYSAFSYSLIFNNINDSKSANRILHIRLYGIIN